MLIDIPLDALLNYTPEDVAETYMRLHMDMLTNEDLVKEIIHRKIDSPDLLMFISDEALINAIKNRKLNINNNE